MTTEARPQDQAAALDEHEEVRRRVWLVEERLFMMVEFPNQTPLTVDLMFNRLHPRVDRPSGASIRSWISVLERVSKRHANASFIFGHAKPNEPLTGSSKDLLYFRDYLTAVMDHVKKGISGKKSMEEILKVESTWYDELSAGGSTRFALKTQPTTEIVAAIRIRKTACHAPDALGCQRYDGQLAPPSKDCGCRRVSRLGRDDVDLGQRSRRPRIVPRVNVPKSN